MIDGNSSTLALGWEVGKGTETTLLDLFHNNGSIIEQKVINATTLKYLFDELEPGREYIVSIGARNTAGDSDRVNFTVYTGE